MRVVIRQNLTNVIYTNCEDMNKEKNEGNLVRIYVFDNDIDAHMAHDVLANNGVESSLSNQLMSSLLPLDWSSVSRVGLWVFECDASRAAHILREHGWGRVLY